MPLAPPARCAPPYSLEPLNISLNARIGAECSASYPPALAEDPVWFCQRAVARPRQRLSGRLTSAAVAVQRPVDKTKLDPPQEPVDNLRNTRRRCGRLRKY